MSAQTDTQEMISDASWQDRLVAANINPTTYLATDYLNHFNELVMLLEFLPDMPDMFAEVEAWAPMSYAAHFHNSGFVEKDVIIKAYEQAPDRFRRPFDAAVAELNASIGRDIAELREQLATADRERLVDICAAMTGDLQTRIAAIGGIVNGFDDANDQDAIDSLFDD